ncbi:hypothetical protein WMF45_12850 [Sorangium sp. So ce448]|uniref:hypothetical protein n=1 Tax=Sorangium sp. So ce448 TaxID=3133314 RepID=UPI003F63CCB0
MGIEIQQDHFKTVDYRLFKTRLQQNLAALEMVLARPGFGHGEATIGAELEMFLVDREARPVPIGAEIARAAASPMITPEMGAFDIELSTQPVPLAGRPLSALREQMRATVEAIRERAAALGARVVPVSILPTFQRRDFSPATITNLPRYRALAAGLCRLRRAPFHIQIDGAEPLELTSDDPAMEAANTAFQIHLRATPDAFARLFNAAMMMTAPALAASCNSPTFLGHRLWHETRVAVFKQAGDDRPPAPGADWKMPARIGFGTGWVRDGAAELFMESVALHEPILPVCGDEDVVGCARAGGIPQLHELRLHHGTVWNWNRPVYDPAGDGHLRIELRALPSGPTLDDMLANGSFLLGGILALAPSIAELLPSFPFELAVRNFYHAAHYGLDAELVWPAAPGAAPRCVRARDLLLSLLPRVEEGLVTAGVDGDEARHYLRIFEARVAKGITGATWQLRALSALETGSASREEALRKMLERYMAEVDSGAPVHAWGTPRAGAT